VLAYSLPEPVITGTVAISEPAAAGGDIIGALRFTDATGTISGTPAGAGAVMIYYEDTGLPANLTAGNFLFGPTETSWAGYSTFDYIPGGVPYPQNNQYHYEGVGGAPEPPSWVLLGCALAAMGLFVYRRRQHPQHILDD